MTQALVEALREARELLEAGSDIIAYDVIDAALAAYDAEQYAKTAYYPITQICLVNCGKPPEQCACLGGNPNANAPLPSAKKGEAT